MKRMYKTLNDAIGCWTVNPNYNSLPHLAMTIRSSAVSCRCKTLRNYHPQLLLDELKVLRRRLDAMIETTDSAVTRCQQIIDTKELEQPYEDT